MQLAQIFIASDAFGSAQLRSIDSNAIRFGAGVTIGTRDWDAAIRWAEDVCAFTEAVLEQKQVTTHGAPFSFHLSWLQPPARCNCILALPVFVIVNLATQLLLTADEDELTDPAAVDRQRRLDTIINPVIGLTAFLVDRVLPAWADLDEAALGLTVKHTHQLRTVVRAYGLWTLGQISLANATNAERYATFGMECKDLLTGRNDAKCLEAAQYFFEAREVMRRNVPDEFVLQWGTLFLGSGIHNYCAKDRLDLTCAQSLVEVHKQLKKPRPSAIERSGWIKRCSTDFIVAQGYHYANDNQREVALACLCAASNNGAEVRELIEECIRTLGTSSQRTTLPASAEPYVKTLRGSKALMRGKPPCVWGTPLSTEHRGTKLVLSKRAETPPEKPRQSQEVKR